MKDKHFIDWESHVFGYGYGTGEQYILQALKDFVDCIPLSGYYHYEKLEQVGKTVAWLMINIFCKQDLIDYGTSPRGGWLSEKGIIFKKYLNTKTVDELYDLTSVDEEYNHCYPDHCNCDKPCNNPLFKH